MTEPLDLKYLMTFRLPEPKPGDLVESVISWAEQRPDHLADLLRARQVVGAMRRGGDSR